MRRQLGADTVDLDTENSYANYGVLDAVTGAKGGAKTKGALLDAMKSHAD